MGQEPRLKHTGQIAIVVESQMLLRILESAVLHIGMTATALKVTDFMDPPDRFELILAEPLAAAEVLKSMTTLGRRGDPYRPAIIVAVAKESLGTAISLQQFDGVLPLPQQPAELAASLSIAIYAHRAFERRFGETLDELELNRGIFQSVTSGVSVADASKGDFPLTYVNPAFEAISGYSLEEVIGRNCRFLQGDRRDQPGLAIIREALRDRQKATAVLRNFRKDGTPFWNELSMSPIFNREGELTHFVGIQTDVTARVEFEIALRESEKLAAVGRLASTIAHEINNPLEAITNLVYLARGSESFDEAGAWLDMADHELRRVKLITEQSLRFNKQSFRPQAVIIPELITSVLDVLERRILNAGVSVERDGQSQISVVCLASEIRQVLNNLIINAIDAMHAKGNGRLIVRSRRSRNWRTEVDGVSILIVDTGVGIPAHLRPNIFKAFFTTKGDVGNGLGLWICEDIVGRHHGTLKMKSRVNANRSGTAFRIFLPFQALEGEQKEG